MRLKLLLLAFLALGSVLSAQEVSREAVLARLIVALRDDALERGVAEAPAEVRSALQGFVDQDALDSVRWRIDGASTLVGMGMLGSGAARAITLDNVILFANAEEAANVRLWAHEICHVMQYREWGIDGFAARYLADRRSVERAAREFRWNWMKATGRVPSV